MSVKPICASPDDLKKYSFKEFKAGFFKAVKKLAKKHDSPQTAAPFYLHTEQKYTDKDCEFFMVFGKLAKWRKYAKDNAMVEQGLRGACYVSYNAVDKCLVINLMPVAGKLKDKEMVIGRIMKTVVSKSRCQIVINKGTFDEAMLENLEKATESMEDVPDDKVGDEMEDKVAEMHEIVEEAAASGLTPAQSQKLAEMTADIETLENLLERMAASDDVAEIQSLDKEIRLAFSKYAGAK